MLFVSDDQRAVFNGFSRLQEKKSSAWCLAPLLKHGPRGPNLRLLEVVLKNRIEEWPNKLDYFGDFRKNGLFLENHCDDSFLSTFIMHSYVYFKSKSPFFLQP
jgi:hypothetical protein